MTAGFSPLEPSAGRKVLSFKHHAEVAGRGRGGGNPMVWWQHAVWVWLIFNAAFLAYKLATIEADGSFGQISNPPFA
jgi:hypothetical protein